MATPTWHLRPPDRVEDHPALDVAVLKREGFLEPGTRTWHGDDGECGLRGLTIVTRGDLVEFRRGGERISATVLTWTPCNFGGQRVWFTCPACERRCRKLHFAPYFPRCRDCADLRYESQLEDELQRGLRRARRIRRQLGGDERLDRAVPLETAEDELGQIPRAARGGARGGAGLVRGAAAGSRDDVGAAGSC